MLLRNSLELKSWLFVMLWGISAFFAYTSGRNYWVDYFVYPMFWGPVAQISQSSIESWLDTAAREGTINSRAWAQFWCDVGILVVMFIIAMSIFLPEWRVQS